MKRSRTLQLIIIANLTALGVLFYFFPKFSLPIFPTFLEFHFSNLPAIIGGYALGPIAGGVIVISKTFLKMLFSDSFFIGEMIDLIIGLSTVMVSSLIYKKFRTKKGAIYGMIAGVFTWVIVAVLANYFFVIDLYVELFFQGNAQILVDYLTMIPGVTIDNYLEKYILYAAIPFNLMISILVYSVTFLVYKRISHLIDDLAKRFQK